MENQNRSIEKANQTSKYTLMTWGILICMVGTFVRFAADNTILSIASWAVLLVGTIICIKAVFAILNSR